MLMSSGKAISRIMKESPRTAACNKLEEDWSWRKDFREGTSEETKVKFIDDLICLKILNGICWKVWDWFSAKYLKKKKKRRSKFKNVGTVNYYEQNYLRKEIYM